MIKFYEKKDSEREKEGSNMKTTGKATKKEKSKRKNEKVK
jgi:hypothetical protein